MAGKSPAGFSPLTDMGPCDSAAYPRAHPTTSSSSSSVRNPTDIDGMLVGAGCRFRSSELGHVDQHFELLESAMIGRPIPEASTSASEPSDPASWVEAMLSNLAPLPRHPPPQVPDFSPDLSDVTQISCADDCAGLSPQPAMHDSAAWTDHISTLHPYHIPPALSMAAEMDEEDSGICLVHLLMSCAGSVHRGELAVAASLVEEMKLLLGRVNIGCAIGKVAGCFIDALSRRIFCPSSASGGRFVDGDGFLYYHFYEAAPYLKFAHFTANQAILEAFDGHECVHVIDFNLMHGLQWPALIQAIALRPGGPHRIRLTGIGPPSPDGRDSLRDIGFRLADLARSVNVRLEFRGVEALRLDQVDPRALEVGVGEAVAVNSIMQLHRLVGGSDQRPTDDSAVPDPIEAVLGWVRELRPRVMTVVEQEANHNEGGFLQRFTEALHYYSTVFDSMEECGAAQPGKGFAEMHVQREICNVICCEGTHRVERHEPLGRWRGRMAAAGFRPVPLGSDAFKQAGMLLTFFSAVEGYSVEENDGCLTLGWHNRPLIAASAWHAVATDDRRHHTTIC